MNFSLLKFYGVVKDDSWALYKLTNYSDEKVWVLASYLSEEVIIDIGLFKTFSETDDEEDEPANGNLYCTGIRNGKMTIGYVYDDPYIVEMSKAQYADMIKTWDELIHKKVQYILITIGDDESVNLKAISDDEAKQYEKK